MLSLGIVGASGRMGTELRNLISQDERFEYVAGLAGKPSDDKTVSDINQWDPHKIDAVVDFSLPDSFEQVFKWCSKNQKPLVSGTTGFDVEKFSREADFPFMHSGNFSLGVAGLLKSISAFQKMSGKAKVWVEDYHHINKLDAPSGTAVKIQKRIEADLNKEDIEVKAVRAGSIFGVHNVHIATDQEWVTLTHRALNRGVFAEGALNAVEWLAEQKAEAYTFEDFLGF